MDDLTKRKIQEHAAAVYPSEACGVLVMDDEGQEHFYACRNLSENDAQFILCPEDYLYASNRGTISAIVHSHPDASPEPSQADKVACEKTKLPWHIVGYPNIKWHTIYPEGYKAPLIGREWCHGILDCLTIVRDWYEYEKGITIKDFFREDEWWKKGGNLYLEKYEEAGFELLKASTPLEIGDVILINIKSQVPNHGAIYLGNDLILHHLTGRLSGREVYGGYYKKHTTHILRYKGEGL